MRDTTDTDTDIETLRHEKFMALLGTFNKHIEHYCVAHSNSHDEADDLMQEVFIAVWTSIDGLHSDSTPRQVNRWLYKVMRTVFIRHLRHQPGHGAPLSDAMEIATEESEYDSELLEELIAHLPADDQELLKFRFMGYSNIEMAQKLGLKVNTLNQRMTRIVKKMKDIYTLLYEN